MNRWQTMIADLKGQGMTYVQIGEAIGLTPQTVGDLAAERHDSPRGDAALKLDALHRRRCKPNGRKRA